jgi:hypothetical protein
MSTIELQDQIIKLIQSTTDESKLRVAFNALNEDYDEALLASISQAKLEAKQGLGSSHKKSMEKYQQWL